jgi:hypothetical protein
MALAPPPEGHRFELGDQIVLLGSLARLRKVSKYL